ncbi:uncharacterized protein PV09_00775 [Verruconis gallopava]|uniref:DNA repair protein Rad26 n=1 Tax=Verruconis gallopava TaxID=253628 RepID=A0A0D2BBU2_9PEZI|nr:uncharacterized protein PV09_00775 [Verruconis gallopava]KIW08849.1 hypothetical protein PV09_00775 [Verruconis gallopava]
MADTDEDDEFGSDDVFEQLPPTTLLQLERQATQFAQTEHHQSAYHKTKLPPDENKWHSEHQQSAQSTANLRPSYREQDYNYDDEEVIDLDQDPYAIRPRFDPKQALVESLPNVPRPSTLETSLHSHQGPPANQSALAELQARIVQLENDRLDLQRQIEEARSTAQLKAGEASILRQKAEKAAKDYEQKIASIKQLHAEERAKHKAELDRVKSDREKLTTHNRFLEHDLALETDKNRKFQRMQRPIIADSSKSGQGSSPTVTPKKSKVLPYRDGFDDSDLVMVSPSKPKDRSKPTTPKAGAKRKRTGNDNQSPIPLPQLPLSEPKGQPIPLQSRADFKVTAEILQKLAREQNKLRFLQRLLQHTVSEDGEDNILEALTRFNFPSSPDRKLSTIFFEQLVTRPLADFGDSNLTIADTICNALCALWEQSLTESYYPPISSLISSIQRVFELERSSFAQKYVSRIVPLAIATSDLVAIPLARASLNKSQSLRAQATRITHAQAAPGAGIGLSESNGEVEQKEEAAQKYIDVFACLELLNTLAEAATPNKDAITLFWQHMKFDFVLMLLMKAQPIGQIGLMLELLRTSALQDTFGAISDGERERQDRREIDTLDRLTVLLGEKFEQDRSDITSTALFEMRERVIAVLVALVSKEHGALLIATHRHAIGRLFKFLHASINSLYLYTQSSDHSSLIRSINSAVTILYLLCSSTGAVQTKVNVDIRQKLSVIPGGMHIHLLALTRLAFAERIWYERGIEESSMERAHEMLDEWLSPEEGEGLMMMFGSESSGDSMDIQ